MLKENEKQEIFNAVVDAYRALSPEKIKALVNSKPMWHLWNGEGGKIKELNEILNRIQRLSQEKSRSLNLSGSEERCFHVVSAAQAIERFITSEGLSGVPDENIRNSLENKLPGSGTMQDFLNRPEQTETFNKSLLKKKISKVKNELLEIRAPERSPILECLRESASREIINSPQASSSTSQKRKGKEESHCTPQQKDSVAGSSNAPNLPPKRETRDSTPVTSSQKESAGTSSDKNEGGEEKKKDKKKEDNKNNAKEVKSKKLSTDKPQSERPKENNFSSAEGGSSFVMPTGWGISSSNSSSSATSSSPSAAPAEACETTNQSVPNQGVRLIFSRFGSFFKKPAPASASASPHGETLPSTGSFEAGLPKAVTEENGGPKVEIVEIVDIEVFPSEGWVLFSKGTDSKGAEAAPAAEVEEDMERNHSRSPSP